MSTGSLFDSENNKGSNLKIVTIAIIALVVMCGSAFGLFWYTKPTERTSDDVIGEEIRDTTVMMLAQPGFTGEEFREQILGKGRLVKFVWSLKDAYFIYPESDDGEFEAFLNKYCADRAKIDFAKVVDGELKLGGQLVAPSQLLSALDSALLEKIPVPMQIPCRGVRHLRVTGMAINRSSSNDENTRICFSSVTRSAAPQ